MTVLEAVERDLRALQGVAGGFPYLTLCEAAKSLAARLDDSGTSATAAASCAKELREVLVRLRELVPEQPAGDRLDELAKRRRPAS